MSSLVAELNVKCRVVNCCTKAWFHRSGSSGYFCPIGSVYGNGTTKLGGIANLCPSGAFCPSGSAAPVLCPVGKYSATEGLKDASGCQLCDAGSYCDEAGLTEPAGLIEHGYYSGLGVITPRPHNTTCPAGHHCPRGSSSPNKCAVGTYAHVIGLSSCLPCPAGFYCRKGTIIPVVCPKGHICPEFTGNGTSLPCPAGYWSNKTQQKQLTDCLPIPPGYFATGIGNPKLDGLCAPGYYCVGYATSATPPADSSYGGPCGKGSACYAGSTEDVRSSVAIIAPIAD